MSRATATMRYLRACREARAAGHRVSYTTDPKWLVNAAINRRGGWVEDRHTRAFAEANHRGEFPRRATLTARGHLAILAREINTPRLVVRLASLGEWRAYLTRRLPERFADGTESN